MYWVCVIALFGFSVLFNICFIVALAYLNRKILHNLIQLFHLISISDVESYFGFGICFCNSNAALGESKSVILNDDDDEVRKKKQPFSHWKKTATDRGSASTASSFEG